MSQPSPESAPFRRTKRSWIQKFSDAFVGIHQGSHGQSSFLVHVPVAVVVILLAFILRLPIDRWCLLLICMGIVLAAELFNSSLETICRAITDQEDPHIRAALNIASAAVLIVALVSALVGCLVFLPAILQAVSD